MLELELVLEFADEGVVNEPVRDDVDGAVLVDDFVEDDGVLVLLLPDVVAANAVI
ncbi:hypothetical protein [Paenibacillus tyrfis]|uniref:hypothetical protein n=1 Tax=Paenibacillus tyrfis TaxID=1501230 RepID=UPI0013776531|nr:hypothetical protein [Paenibacillus tyrfis]